MSLREIRRALRAARSILARLEAQAVVMRENGDHPSQEFWSEFHGAHTRLRLLERQHAKATEA